MTFFLILIPFASFAMLTLVATAATSLFAAAAVAFAVVMFDVVRGGSVKILSAGCGLLFTALGCYITLVDGHWSNGALRLTIDGGVLAIALLSLTFRLPFTLQYAREKVDVETMKRPGFLRANYIITWAWTAAFVLMLVADMLMIYLPQLPLWFGFVVAFAARNCAVAFTKWYPKYHRAKFAALTASPVAIHS
jgi:hypothetical protein